MRIDLHVHTSRYSACGKSSPEEMVSRAAELGLDAIVITEHHRFWPAEELADLQARYPQVRLFTGIEVSSAGGSDLLIYGPTGPDIFYRDMPPREVIRQARAMDAVVVLAHPFRYAPEIPDFLDEDWNVDGIEIMSIHMLGDAHVKARALARQFGATEYAASDGHHVDTIGLYAVELERPARDERDLADLLRARRFTHYVDIERVTAANDALQAQLDEIRRLIDLGHDNDQIRQVVPGLGYTTLTGIRQGLDVLLPTRPVNSH
jgi:hypothetical protein